MLRFLGKKIQEFRKTAAWSRNGPEALVCDPRGRLQPRGATTQQGARVRVHACVCACVRVRACARACVCACVRACVRASSRAQACVCARTRVRFLAFLVILATLAFSAISVIFAILDFSNFCYFGNFCNFSAEKPTDFHAFFSHPIFSNALGPAHALPRLP